MGFYSTSLGLVGVYVGLNILINFFLAYRVSANRVRSKVMTGTGDDEQLYNANRAHVTNVEYVLIALAGLIVLHLLAHSIYVMHIVCLPLTSDRSLHAIVEPRTSVSSPPS